MRKHGLRTLGLCLTAALGIMAFVTSAQAEEGAHWKVEGRRVVSELVPEVQTEGLEGNDASLLTISGVNKINLLCTSMTFIDTTLESEGNGSGKAKFSGCKTLISGIEAPKCLPKSPGATSGTIETNLLKVSIVLHEGPEGYYLVEPASTATDPEFINIVLGESCSIGEFMPVYGKLVLKDSQEEGRVEKVTHLIEEGPTTTLRVFEPLEAGTPATIDGSANIKLAGAHTGLKWSGAPS